MQYKNLLKVVERNGRKVPGTGAVTLSKQMFYHLVVTALRARNEFDEKHYLATYPDIRDAVRTKKVKSAADHYFQSGYFEGRVPKKLTVDDAYYREQNPDVVEAIRKGTVKSCQEHFDLTGFREGRAPFEDFSLF